MKKIRFRTGVLDNFMLIPDAEHVIKVTDDEDYIYQWQFNYNTKKLFIFNRYLPRKSKHQNKKTSEYFERDWEFNKNITVHYFLK